MQNRIILHVGVAKTNESCLVNIGAIQLDVPEIRTDKPLLIFITMKIPILDAPAEFDERRVALDNVRQSVSRLVLSQRRRYYAKYVAKQQGIQFVGSA